MAYVSTPGLHEEFAQPDAAEPAALHFQEDHAPVSLVTFTIFVPA